MMFLKILVSVVYFSVAYVSAPTDIACVAKDRGAEAIQLYCGDRWTEVHPLPLIEARFDLCSRSLRSGTLVFRTRGSEFEINDPEFPLNITLNGVDLMCDEISY